MAEPLGPSKCLSLWQPWASLIALRAKHIETRSWSTSYRGPLAIHASKKCVPGTIGDYEIEDDTPRGSAKQYLMRGASLSWPYRLPLGAVVATCTLADVVPMVVECEEEAIRRLAIDVDGSLWLCEPEPDDDADDYPRQDWREVTDQVPYGDFAPGRYGWVLSNIRAVGPIMTKGHQGLWEWKP